MSDVLESKIEHFVKMGGYDIVRKITRGKNKGKFRNISEAARRTGISRPTIYAILEKYPEKPSKTKPKYVDKLEDSEGYKRLEQMFEKRISSSAWSQTKSVLRRAFKILGYNKDPMTWTEEDYRILWAAEMFHSDECKGINKPFAIALRRVMRATDNHNLLAKFKFNNPPEGKKKQWFMHDDDIIKEINHIEAVDVLMFFFTGIGVGARSSALIGKDKQHGVMPKDVDTIDDVLMVYEPKVQSYVLKFPPKALVRMLDQYITDFKISNGQKLFPNSYTYYKDALLEAGKKAGLRKKITTHILKHTFVTQANRHGCSAETIVHQTGTELRCLEKFYRATNENKLRHEMQGRKHNFKPFPEWISELSYYVRARYNQLREKNDANT